MLEELSRRTGISADNLRDYVATHKPPQQYSAEPSSQPPQHHEPIGEEPPEIYGGVDYEPYPETVTARTNKIRLSPVKFLTALLINHPQLAEYVEDIEILRVSADIDMALFLKILALINSGSECTKTSHIFARWQANNGDQQDLQLLKTLAGSELHQPPKGTGRDDDQEFTDTLAHVMRDAFEALPGERKATFLLSQETLTERQIKQLLKIHMQLGDDIQNIELKNKIKQRLVV
jgi:DNA primase